MVKSRLEDENIDISKGVYLTMWTINILPLTTLYETLLNIIGGKGAVPNINYYQIISIAHVNPSNPIHLLNTAIDKPRYGLGLL